MIQRSIGVVRGGGGSAAFCCVGVVRRSSAATHGDAEFVVVLLNGTLERGFHSFAAPSLLFMILFLLSVCLLFLCIVHWGWVRLVLAGVGVFLSFDAFT